MDESASSPRHKHPLDHPSSHSAGHPCPLTSIPVFRVIGEQNMGLRAPGSVNVPELGGVWGNGEVGWRWDLEEPGALLVRRARLEGADTLITPADSRAALVGRVWRWPARLSAARRHQSTTILTPSVISHPFPALHVLFRTHCALPSLKSE